jgi:hypothetical protein
MAYTEDELVVEASASSARGQSQAGAQVGERWAGSATKSRPRRRPATGTRPARPTRLTARTAALRAQADAERCHQQTWQGIVAWLQATLARGRSASIHGLCKVLCQPGGGRPLFVLSDTFARLHGASAGLNVAAAGSLQGQPPPGGLEELNCGRIAARWAAGSLPPAAAAAPRSPPLAVPAGPVSPARQASPT